MASVARSGVVEGDAYEGAYGPIGRRFLVIVYGLVILGIVFVFSSSFPGAGRPTPYHADAYFFLKSHLQHAGIGLVGMVLVSLLPLGLIKRLSRPAFLVGLILMAAAAIWGRRVGDARCWIWGFQPSEFAKVAYVATVALYLARGPMDRKNLYTVVLPIVVATGLMVGLLFQQSDQGMAMLMVLLALALAFVGGARPRYLIPTALALLGLAMSYALTKPYIVVRIKAWLRPEDYIHQAGYHIYGMLIATARGGVFGCGLGMSPDKWRTLPVPHTDSIYCVIAGELGLWGALGVLFIIVLLAAVAFQIGWRSRSRLGFYLAVGMGVALTLQALVNIAVATALIPPTGLTLPFISAGGSSLISSLLAAGVVLAVARHNGRRGGNSSG